jgi:hypothetical protein
LIRLASCAQPNVVIGHSMGSNVRPKGVAKKETKKLWAIRPSEIAVDRATNRRFLFGIALYLDKVNAVLSPISRGSYQCNIMEVGGASIYEWTRESGAWRFIKGGLSR